jgi:cobalt-zinc-cadmium efflux system outer membrane protein
MNARVVVTAAFMLSVAAVSVGAQVVGSTSAGGSQQGPPRSGGSQPEPPYVRGGSQPEPPYVRGGSKPEPPYVRGGSKPEPPYVRVDERADQEALASRYVDPQRGLTLEQAIAQALEREPSIQAARVEITAAQGLRAQADLRPNPTLTFERREEPGGPDNLTGIALEWPLDLFRKDGRVLVADRELEAVRHSVADRERLLAAAVRAQYGDVLAAIRTLSVSDELIAAVRQQLAVVRARVAEGATPPVERDLIDVEVRRLESDRLLNAGRVETTLLELKRLLGLRATDPLAVSDTLEQVVVREHTTPPATASDDAAVSQRPDIREAEARVLAAESRIDRAHRDGKFDMSLFASYMRMKSMYPQFAFGAAGAFEQVGATFNYVTFGAMMTLPLRNQNQGEVAAAEAGRALASARHTAATLAADAELAAARLRDGRARQAVAIYTGGARDLARQNLSVITQTYELGRATVFEVLAEQRRYLELEQTFTDALREAYEARTALQRARGDVR